MYPFEPWRQLFAEQSACSESLLNKVVEIGLHIRVLTLPIWPLWCQAVKAHSFRVLLHVPLPKRRSNPRQTDRPSKQDRDSKSVFNLSLCSPKTATTALHPRPSTQAPWRRLDFHQIFFSLGWNRCGRSLKLLELKCVRSWVRYLTLLSFNFIYKMKRLSKLWGDLECSSSSRIYAQEAIKRSRA